MTAAAPVAPAPRDFFPGLTTLPAVARYVALLGPLTPTPNLTLADVVRQVAA